MNEIPVDLNAFLTVPQFELDTFEAFGDLAFASAKSHQQFAAIVEQARGAGGRDDSLRLAIGLLLLGRFSEALDTFKQATDNKYRRFYAAQAAEALGRFDQAISELESAAEKGWSAFDCDLLIAAIRVRAGNVDAAEKLVKRHERAGTDREAWYYAHGLVLEAQGERDAARIEYEKALQLAPAHLGSAFRAAWLADQAGDDARAIELYQEVALQPRAFVNALINLAVIYEDHGRFVEAAQCLRRVLVAYPNHARARLFLKDVESSRLMVIEEAGDKRSDPRNRVLDTSVNEFELSVRARNCRKKMKVSTLGDLIRLTETELMAYKNFGETSLNEIKQLLAKRGLKLGQRPDEIDPATIVEQPAPAPRVSVPPGAEALLGKPVSELELSVRARRCLQRLNIVSVGDLIQHSEQDLLSTRNFGVTSLTEIKLRLKDLNLELAPRT